MTVPTRKTAQVDALAELIRQPYALDPGSLEFLVEESQGVPDGAVRAICSVLEVRDLSAIERENLENFIRRVALQPTIRRALEKCAERKGRCPKPKKPWLRRVLALGAGRSGLVRAQDIDLSAPAEIHSEPVGGTSVSGGVTSLDLQDLSGKIDEMPRLLLS